MKRTRFITVFLTLLITALSCGAALSEERISYVKVNKIKLNINAVTIAINQSVDTVRPVILPSNAADQKLIWSSQNKSVASVDSNGRITGVKKGVTYITVKASGNAKVKAKLKVTVVGKGKGVTGISLNQAELTIAKGSKSTLKAIITPKKATNRKISWVSSNTKVATVSSKGVISAKKAGTAEIRAVASSGLTATCKVSVVVQKKVKKLTLAGDTVMSPGGAQTLDLKYAPADAWNKAVKWTSSNKKVLKVTSGGEVKALKEGTATITAKAQDGGKAKASIKITVKKIKVTKLTITGNTVMSVGGTQTLGVTCVPANAWDKSVKWTSSNTGILSVTSGGEVKALKEGTATITAKAQDGSNVRASIEIRVVKKKITGLKIIGSSVMAVDNFQTLEVEYTPADAGNKAVKWTTSDKSVLEVDSYGEVSSVKQGTAIITASAQDGSNVSASIEITVVPSSGVQNGLRWKAYSYKGTVGACIDGYDTSPVELVIPEKVSGLPVIKISDYAFKECESLTSAFIPDSVQSIGGGAFMSCTSLTDVRLPNRLIELPYHVFYYCGSLKRIDIPDTVQTIGLQAFWGCVSLTEARLPKQLTFIGELAFTSCKKLTSVHIPAGVTYIGSNAFMDCPFDSITVDANNTSYKAADNVLYSIKDQSIVKYAPGKPESSYVFPQGIKAIEAAAFEGTKNLKTIAVPSGVTVIPESAFYDSSLEEITLPQGIKSIDSFAFSGSGLKKIELPSTVNYIGDCAFFQTAIDSIVIPEGVSDILGLTFYRCNNLRNVKLPASLRGLAYCAFEDCGQLRNLVLPEGVTSIGEEAFNGCASLDKLVIPVSLAEIHANAFGEIQYPLLVVTQGSAAESAAKQNGWRYVVSNANTVCPTGGMDGIYVGWDTALGVLGAGGEAVSVQSWQSDSNLVATVDASGMAHGVSAGSVTITATLADGAKVSGAFTVSAGNAESDFEYTTSGGFATITGYTGNSLNLVIPRTLGGCPVKYIDDCAFRFAVFRDAYIPDTVRYIYSNSLGFGAFNRCFALRAFHVSENNPVYYTIDGVLFGRNIYIDGYTVKQALIQYPYTRNENSYSIPEGTTGLYAGAFEANRLIGVTLPDGLIVIGYSAFQLSGLSLPVNIPSSVEYFSNNAFAWCLSLEAITVDSSSAHFKAVDGVLFSKDMETLVAYPSGRRAASYTVPSGVRIIGDSSFDSVYYLRSLTLPDGVTSIERYAFYNANVEKITLPDTLTDIRVYAFMHSKVEEIVIPAKCDNIEEGAFSASSLSKAYFKHGPTDGIAFGENSFSSCPVFYARSGGSAEAYAREKGFTFVPLDAPFISVKDNLAGGESAQAQLMLTADTPFERSVTWASDNPAVVTVSEKGVITAKGSGTATLRAVSDELSLTAEKRIIVLGQDALYLPQALCEIGNSAFCGSDTKAVVCGENVAKIGKRAFADFPGLSLIVIPEGTYYIADDAFTGSDNVVIACKPGSYAEEYAIKNGFAYCSIE